MDEIRLRVDGREVKVKAGTTVAVAILQSGEKVFRASCSGQPRGPLCGMGICYECRVAVDGMRHVRSCMVLCRPDMEVETR